VLLRWLRPWRRWLASIAVIGWFVFLTRAEPSVLRAGAMAALAATAHVRGQQISSHRLLLGAMGALVLVDPLLVWSVGFWLSVGATFGVAVIAPRLEPWLPGAGWFRAPAAVTIGAQLGVAIPSVLVFGRLPVGALWTNLLAVPVAGAVMLFGLPCGILAAVAPPLAPLLMAPLHWAVWWVVTVARLGAVLEPRSAAGVAGAWLAVIVGLVGVAMRRARRRLGPAGGVRH
jgi:competence protein ComEC